MHLLGQLIPPPLTLPAPVMFTTSWAVSVLLAQAAPICLSPSMRTVQESPVPAQAPPQPVKTSPASGVWKTVSTEPVSTVQVQSVPAGAEPQSITEPAACCSGPLTLPSPRELSYVTVSVLSETPEVFLKFAVAMWSVPSSGIEQSLSVPPAQSSVQMSSSQPPPGSAFSVTVPVSE